LTNERILLKFLILFINFNKFTYLQGVSIINSLGRTHLGIKIADIRITLKGLEYLEENSLMKKAAHLIKGVTEIIK
jgi:hypothetical protein